MDRLAGPLAALVLAAGCTVNPFYVPPTTGAGSTTGEGSSSSPGTSWASTTDVSTGSTNPGVTSEPSTTSGLIPDMGVPETSGGTSGGEECLNEKTLTLQGSNLLEDAFFTANPFDEICDLLEVSEPNWPCGILNLGAIDGMTMKRVEMGPEVMFALQPTSDLSEVIESLELQNNQILGAQISVTIIGLSEDVTFEVGVIDTSDIWVAGAGYGNLVFDGEATFDLRVTGDAPENWTNQDGPRGASTPLCQMSIPGGDYVDYTPFTVCDLDPAELGKLALGHGVVIFFPDDGLPHYGPVFKSTDAPLPDYHPKIEIRYCPP